MATELFDPKTTYSAPAGAKLVYNGGPLMENPKLFAIFVHDGSGDKFPFVGEMETFLQFLGTSSALAEIAEYGKGLVPATLDGAIEIEINGQTPPPPPPPPPGCGCIPGPVTGHAHVSKTLRAKQHRQVAAALAQTTLSDADIQNLLNSWISSQLVPPPASDMLFLLFFPDSVQISFGTDASCVTFCGYHNNYQFDAAGTQVFYAVLPFPSCNGCLGGLAPVDALTSVVTHEVAEAITDPIPPTGWYDNNNGEIGDICAWQTRLDGQYTVQKLWLNSRKACV